MKMVFMREFKEDKTMTIKAKSKKNLQEIVKEYRAKGYNLITFTYTLCELERGDEIIVIKV